MKTEKVVISVKRSKNPEFISLNKSWVLQAKVTSQSPDYFYYEAELTHKVLAIIASKGFSFRLVSWLKKQSTTILKTECSTSFLPTETQTYTGSDTYPNLNDASICPVPRR